MNRAPAPPSVAAAPRRLFLRFASWGVVNTLVDLLIYVALATAGLPILVANAVSTSAGLAVSFYGNRRFVFGRSGRTVRELVLFVTVCGFGLWVIQPFVLVVSHPAFARLDLPVLAVWAPKCLAIGVAMVWNFFLYKHVVFRHATRPGLGAAA